MASSLALTNLVSYNLLPKSLHATRQAIPASRLFSTYEKINYWGGPNHQWKHNNSGPIQGPNEHWEHNSRRPVQGPNEHWEYNSWGPVQGPKEHWECNPWGPNQYPWRPGRWPKEHWECNPWGPNQYPWWPGRWPKEHWECNPWGPNQYPWWPGRWPKEHWECNPWGPNQYPWRPGRWPQEHWECNPWGPNQYPWRPGRWPEEHWEHNPCGPNQHLADSSDSFFSTNTSLSERLKMMDKFMDSPYPHATTYRGILPGRWEARETNDGFYIRMYMPGLAKENVYITGKHNYMTIGEVSGNDNRAWRISTTIDLPLKFYKSDQIKAEMKNGVLNIVVLKSEKEERDEEFHVNVE